VGQKRTEGARRYFGNLSAIAQRAACPQLLRVKDVAKRLGLSEDAVRSYVGAGILPARQYVPRGAILIDEDDVEVLIERSRGEAVAA